MQKLASEPSVNIDWNDKKFTVYSLPVQTGYLFYFVNDTYYKNLEIEYNDRRPVVAMISFDNREELSRDSSVNEDVRIASEVETALRDWAEKMGGFLKKLSGGRFFMLTDEAHIRKEMKERFSILDKIRTIKNSENRSATISVGIGRDAETLAQGELWARKALDMALGRGGDQVAVRQKEEHYSFFGGLSKGVEKRDKVRTRVIAATISDHVKNSDAVFIMGHRFSDLDCVGAAIGLYCAVTKGLSKPAYVVVNRNQSLAGSLIKSFDATHKGGEHKPIFILPDDARDMITQKSLLVIVDTHSPDFVEDKELLQKAGKVIVIDHHRMMVKHIENALVFYHEPYASSASEMVAELVQYISENSLDRGGAEALLAGIMLDTKNFVLKTGVRTFEASAYLRRRGADTVSVKRLFSDDIKTYKTKYRLISTADLKDGCAVAFSDEEWPDIRIAAAQAADELLSIQGVHASFVIFPAGGVTNISARSLGDINVQVIMEEMGGGGHLTMAATQLKGKTSQQAKEELMQVLQTVLPHVSKVNTDT